MEQIRNYFENWIQQRLTEEDWRFFSSKLIRHEYAQKQILLDVGQVENNLSFVEKGILRFYIPKKDNDLTLAFVFDRHFASAYDSFLTRKPSIYKIETLSPTTLWQLHYDDLQEIYKNTSIGNLIGRKASEDLFLKKSQREYSLLNDTAEQLYLQLLNEQTHLIQKIPLKYIASYIGVTPQALSRIRKRIS